MYRPSRGIIGYCRPSLVRVIAGLRRQVARRGNLVICTFVHCFLHYYAGMLLCTWRNTTYHGNIIFYKLGTVAHGEHGALGGKLQSRNVLGQLSFQTAIY